MQKEPVIKNQYHRVINLRLLTENTFVIRFERNNLQFIPGQYLSVGKESSLLEREYSIYSGLDDPYLEILVREVKDGDISPQLRQVEAGDQLRVSGPFGSMILPLDKIREDKFTFIASGTGIAPFHSYVRSYESLKYNLLHGVRFSNEGYDRLDLDQNKYTLCCSSDHGSDYHGRVTSYLRQSNIDIENQFYVCGNSNMIYEVYSILRDKGVPADRMFSEVYF